MDVGSTTVKAVIVNAETDQIIWQDYQRARNQQPEKLLEFLKRMEAEVGIAPHNCRIFITGSGGGALANLVGAKFVQEVTAVSLAVEKLHPEVNSVIELGGRMPRSSSSRRTRTPAARQKIPSMNDKCAGGTGAVIDKITPNSRFRRRAVRSKVTSASSCIRSRASAASSPRPTSTGCRSKASRPISSWLPCSTPSFYKT